MLRPGPLHGGRAADADSRVLLICVPQADAAQIIDAIRGSFQIRRVKRTAELRAAVGATGALAGIVVADVDDEGTSTLAALGEIARGNPQLPIVALCNAGVEQSCLIRAFVGAGVHEFLFRQMDLTRAAIRSVFSSAVHQCAADAILERVLPLFPRTLHTFVEQCLHQPDATTSVQDVATLLGVNRRTLLSHCARHRLPGPAELLSWCRLFMVAYRLERSAQSIESVALDLDWPSGTALRNMMKRYTGCRASEVRQKGGLPFVIRAFEVRLRVVSRASGGTDPLVVREGHGRT